MLSAPIQIDVSEAPSHGRAYWIHAEDGVRLRVGSWVDENVSRGTVFFFTGRTEYVEKYGRTVSDFTANGYACFLIDWRGQGLSDRMSGDRKAGHVDCYSDYQLDVDAMLGAAHALNLPKPWFMVGNSMGCCIGLRALSKGIPMAASAFLAPMWNIRLSKMERFAAWPISWTLKTLGKGHVYTPGRKGKSYVLTVPFSENNLTDDSDMYDYYIRQAHELPEHQIGSATFGWLYASLLECWRLSDIPLPNTPCISFWGDHDVVVDGDMIERRMSQWENGDFRTVKGGKHDLFCNDSVIRDNITQELSNLFSTSAKSLG